MLLIAAVTLSSLLACAAGQAANSSDISNFYSDSPPVGTIGYSLKSSAECPSVAMSNEITWLVVPASQPQICSIHCANVRDCGGFNYNMQTGKCALLQTWADNSELYSSANTHFRCYRQS